MNKEYRESYEDRIEFLIALMTQDYAKVRDVGDRLLKHGRTDERILGVLDILRQNRKEFGARGRSDSAETDSETSDITDGNDTDSADDNADIRVVTKATSKAASSDVFGSSCDGIGVDFKRNMCRVIPITVSERSDK